MDNDKKIYYLLVFMFTVFISFFISSFLIKNSNIKGKINIEKKYYDIVYESKSDGLTVDNDIININIKNIKDEIYIDAYNIGNKDVKLNNMDVKINNTNLDKDKLNINLNINKNDVIKGGETKRIIFNIDYDGENNENDYLNYSVKFNFIE